MKTQWWRLACAVALLAATSAAGVPKDHGDRGDREGQGRGDREDQNDQGRHRGWHNRFDDRDREAAREWYQEHRSYRGLRDEDRLSPEYEDRLRDGYVMDYQMRRWARPAPYELVERFGPPPPGYRYMIVNNHLVLVDRGYRVHDVMHFELNFGR